MRRLAGWALACLALAGCATKAPVATTAAPSLGMHRVTYADLPGWDRDDPAQALPAFVAACAQMGGAASLGGAGQAAALGGDPAAWRPACAAAAAVAPGDSAAARTVFETYLTPYAVSDAGSGSATGLFTGYYEPEVAGSRVETGQYRTPLLARPLDILQVDLGAFAPDLAGRKITGRLAEGTLVPYYDRSEIEAGALSRRRLELLWLADPVDGFILEIQGSGRVRLPDGHVVRVTFAGQNGRPYVPIGRVLADRGDIPLDKVSMQSIRAWLAAHPAQAGRGDGPEPVICVLPRGRRPAAERGAAGRARGQSDAGALGRGGPPVHPAGRAAVRGDHRPAGRRRAAPAAGGRGHRGRDQGAGPRRHLLGLGCGGRRPSRADARAGHRVRPAAAERPDRVTMRVALFVTCLVDVHRPTVGFAAIRLLERAGCTVEVPRAQTCCGQPAYNSGDRAGARRFALAILQAFEGFEHVVVPSGSCGGMIREHLPHLLADDPNLAARAAALGSRTFELVSFLVDVLGVRSVDAAYAGVATYHDSCSGLRELGVKAQPRALLEGVAGLSLVEMADPEVCCGFGGTFCVKYPEISTRMVSDKVRDVAATGADTLLAGDMGCLLNMAGRLSREGSPVKVRHVAEVLAGMADGPAIGGPGRQTR